MPVLQNTSSKFCFVYIANLEQVFQLFFAELENITKRNCGFVLCKLDSNLRTIHIALTCSYHVGSCQGKSFRKVVMQARHYLITS